MASDQVNGHATQRLALLTRTIVPSPLIRWIIPARLRHRSLNDVVFVGEDYIDIKTVVDGGHLQNVIRKDDFSSRICCAGVFSIVDLDLSEDDIISADPDPDQHAVPPQLLVLVLSSPKILFLYLERLPNGNLKFNSCSVPIPSHPDALNQPITHMAIDPTSRAIALAAAQGETMIYAAKSREDIQEQLRQGVEYWCPVKTEFPVAVDGVVTHICFLNPSEADLDHIILLVLLVESSKTRLRWFDWRFTTGLAPLQTRPPISLDLPRCVASLLIPLRNAKFMLVYGRSIFILSDLLSGSPSSIIVPPIDGDFPPNPKALSPIYPLWTNWCRPSRTPAASRLSDCIYLAREDGIVFWFEVTNDNVRQSSYAGDLECHVGEAFASLGDSVNPDLIAVGGETSTGRIVSIGAWPSQNASSTARSRVETMDFVLVELLSNWTSITDMIVAKVPSSSQRYAQAQESVFMLAGRQPYGTITQLRTGLEAQLALELSFPGLRGVLDIWAVPDSSTGSVALITTTPDSSQLFLLSISDGEICIEAHDTVFDTAHPTLLAVSTSQDYLLQVTERTITLTTSINASFEDALIIPIEEQSTIIAAAFNSQQDLLLCAEMVGSTFQITPWHCTSSNDGENRFLGQDSLTAEQPIACARRPLAIATTDIASRTIVLVALNDGSMELFTCQGGRLNLEDTYTTNAEPKLCDSMALLAASHDSTELLAVCGLRNGELLVLSSLLEERLHFSSEHFVPVGSTAVKVVGDVNTPDRAYYFCGADTGLIHAKAESTNKVELNNIWVTDKAQPHLMQENITSCTKMPNSAFFEGPSQLRDLSDALVLVSGDTLWFTCLNQDVRTIPRQMPVEGTPLRLAYAQAHKCWVCVSNFAEETTYGNEARRKVYPIIQFIPGRNSSGFDERSAIFRLDPGEAVHTILEWTPKQDQDKVWSLILVGGRDQDHGRLHFFAPSIDNGRARVLRQHKIKFSNPVYALALYDTLIFVVCYGRMVKLIGFSFQEKECTDLCEPLTLGSPGMAVSVEAGLIYITTSEDSLVVLSVQKIRTNGTHHTHALQLVSSASQGDPGITHLLLRAPADHAGLVLMSTRERELVGLSVPSSPQHYTAADIEFKAQLPRSVSKLRLHDPRPPWKQRLTAPGVVIDNIIGSCPDGTLLGMLVIDEQLWRRLFWLQRLCEWSAVLSPHTHGSPLYTTDETDRHGERRLLPIGLVTGQNIALSAPDRGKRSPRDMYLDGDVLARLLEPGATDALRNTVNDMARKPDAVGKWLATHLEDELGAIDSTIKEVRILLESWV